MSGLIKAANVYAMTTRATPPPTSGLSAVLRAANLGGLSARAIARLAQQRGHTLNHDTAARYLRGDHGSPDEATLVAFADVLEVPLRKLRAAASLPSETTAPYVPPADSSRLTRRQRRAVDEIIRAMLEPGSANSAPDRAAVSELPTSRGASADRGTRSRGDASSARAARHGQPEPPIE
jgi:transcriptional regulator with XRE-family HTH domain